jgi:hypothetical protein
LNSPKGAEQVAQAFQSVIFALDGDEQVIGSGETKDPLLSSFEPQHPQKAQDHARIKTPQRRQKFAPKSDCLLDKNETASPTKKAGG